MLSERALLHLLRLNHAQLHVRCSLGPTVTSVERFPCFFRNSGSCHKVATMFARSAWIYRRVASFTSIPPTRIQHQFIAQHPNAQRGTSWRDRFRRARHFPRSRFRCSH
jgi:hypothetical protein